ncbi:MAG: FkbM family methyltransferase [Nanoarchaeota archaeon]
MHLYRRITQAHEVFKVSIALFRMWPFAAWIRFWITTKPETIVNVNGIKLAVRTKNFFTRIADVSMAYECVIRDDYNLRGLKPHKESFIIDIGAHIGSFSIAAAKKYPNARILSFEPSPSNYRLLKKNISLNKCKNIAAFGKAVTSHGKRVHLYIDASNPAESGLYARKNKRVDALSINLEKVFRDFRIKKCALVKMDCEGSEYDIILNTPDYVLKKIEAMVIEYHKPEHFGITDRTHRLPNLIRRLEKSGFACTTKRSKSYQGVLTARR